MEDSLSCLNRPYNFKSFKDRLLQTLLCSFLNTTSHLKVEISLIYTGYIDSFLSWRAFIPLSRLTYGVYLIHSIILFWYYASEKALIDMSIFQLVSLFIFIVHEMF